MAKVQAKKAAAAAKKSSAKKAVVRPKSASASKSAKKAPKKPVPPAKRRSKTAKPSKTAKAAKAVAKPVKKAAKAVAKAARPVVKAVTGERAAKAAKNVAKVAAVAAAIPVAAKAAKAIAHHRAGEGDADKKRTRRTRPRIASAGAAVANWFVQEKPRPSSFIPAPPRAEAPSLVAAPPASSDRLIRPEDLTHAAVRTVPVRIDVEAGGGRVFIAVSPIEVTLRPNEGIEWDFRYLGGADVIVDELIIEFDRPSPFGNATFRSKRPGAARPHRQLSGGASNSSAGKRFQYTIRAMNGFKTELATARPSVHILLA